MEENANTWHFKCTNFNSSKAYDGIVIFFDKVLVKLKGAGCCVVAFGGSDVKLFQQLSVHQLQYEGANYPPEEGLPKF